MIHPLPFHQEVFGVFSPNNKIQSINTELTVEQEEKELLSAVVKGNRGRITLVLPNPNLLNKWTTLPSLQDVFAYLLYVLQC